VKAVVIERPHDVAFREVETPGCGPEEVLVRSRLAGVCRTDLEVLEGELDPRWIVYPCIPGHEWSGVVEQVRQGVRDLRIAAERFEDAFRLMGEADGVVGRILLEHQ
jgi:D-arabinose 1-dehydrogenase-like Zn-dependent alcohol dehydrogenase